MSLFNFYKEKIVWQFDVRSHVTQDLEDTRHFKIAALRIQWSDVTCRPVLMSTHLIYTYLDSL